LRLAFLLRLFYGVQWQERFQDKHLTPTFFVYQQNDIADANISNRWAESEGAYHYHQSALSASQQV